MAASPTMVLDDLIKAKNLGARAILVCVRNDFFHDPAVHTLAEMKKRMISMRVEPDVIERLKEKAKRVGIPYQTLAASVLKRYVDSNLDIEAA